MKNTKVLFLSGCLLVFLKLNPVFAATYACHGWRYDDGSGKPNVVKFVYSEDSISVNGVPLTSAGSIGYSGAILLFQDFNKDDSIYSDNFTFLLRTCSAENDLLESKSKFECKQHDLLRLDGRFFYPNFPEYNQITRCLKF